MPCLPVAVVAIWLSAATPAAASDWPPIGSCLADCHGTGCSKRLLNHTVSVNDLELTREKCWSGCGKAGYLMAGLEAGHGCFCAMALAWSSPLLPSSQCCTPCSGNSSEFCGARFRVQVFLTKEPLPPQEAGCPLPPAKQHPIDPRHIANGTIMLRAGYLDQPYCVVLQSQRWVCTITGSTGGEGSHGEHVQSLWSEDGGRSWSHAVTVEPPPLNTVVANAYSTIVAGPGGRVYVIFGMNVGNVTSFPSGKTIGRTDCQGEFVMRWSDDGGQTFSLERLIVPYRLTPVDKNNDFKGSTKEMWTVDQTKTRSGVAYFAFTKIEHYLLAPPEELWVLASPNILTELDPHKVTWNLLPNGDHGVPPPFHNVSDENTVVEEAHIVPLHLSTGFYMIGRTTQGYLAAAWTADSDAKAGWQPTRYAQYWDPTVLFGNPTAGKRPLVPLGRSASAFRTGAGLKNPRGPITTKMLAFGPHAGTHLLLFYNNNGKGYSPSTRNPYWLSAGRETENATILWSQPEIVVYDRIRTTAPGYPDIIQDPTQPTRVVITETEKHIARLHPIPLSILNALFGQCEVNTTAAAGAGTTRLLVDARATREVATPDFGRLDSLNPAFGDGLTIAVVLTRSAPAPRFNAARDTVAEDSKVLLDSRDSSGGIVMTLEQDSGAVSLNISDGKHHETLSTDAVCSRVLATSGTHFVGFIVDAGPLITRVLVDGVLCDGGGVTARGWAWFDNPAGLSNISGANRMRIGSSISSSSGSGSNADETNQHVGSSVAAGVQLEAVQLYTRALLTSELVGNARVALLA